MKSKLLKKLTQDIRFYILLFSFSLGILVFGWISSTIQISTARAVRLDQYYALIAAFFLYFTLLIIPLIQVADNFPFKKQYIKSQSALGISALWFVLLHSSFAFFGELEGFRGLGFLNSKYIIAMCLGFIALIVLSIFVISVFKKWEKLFSLSYILGLLVMIHVLMLGSDFSDLSVWIPQLFFGALMIFLCLEAIRLDKYLTTKYQQMPQFSIAMGLFLIIVTLSSNLLYFPAADGAIPSFNVHAVHIQLAKQAQQGLTNLANINPILLNQPGLQGDRTRRFTVSFSQPDNIQPNQDTSLDFTVYDADSGNQVQLFNFVYTKVMHLVVVDSELNYFNHIHPTQQGSHFIITTQFPHPGRYHLYLDFQPLGAIEQQFAFTVDVGTFDKPIPATQPVDHNFSKAFGNYKVFLSIPKPIKATELSIGNEELTFTIRDLSGKPITTLKPYLAAFGHLVLINEQSYAYIHVHPTNLFPPQPDANGGPTVDFLPLGLYGPIKPGIYRLFAQFNPDNNLFVADFTIQVE